MSEYEITIAVERRMKYKRKDGGLVFKKKKPVMMPVENANGLDYWVRCTMSGRDVYLSDEKKGPFPIYNGFVILDAHRVAQFWAKVLSNRGLSVELTYDEIAERALRKAVAAEGG